MSMLVSFVCFALSVAALFWVDKPWYFALPVAIGVFFGTAFLRAIYSAVTKS